jgi:hypothetical protein
MERRKARRYPVRERATILAEPVLKAECIIRNVSESGALLVLRNADSVPETFTLVSPYHPRMLCRVAWRASRKLGVQFADIPVRPIGG